MHFIFIVFFTFLSAHIAAAQELVINPRGTSLMRAHGQSAVFTCSVTAGNVDANYNLKWFGDDGRQIDQTVGRVYVEQGDTQSTQKLYIADIQPRDAGSYRCEGLLNGKVEFVSVQLELYKDITFDDAPAIQMPILGSAGLIRCIVTGTPIPTVSWRFRGKTIKSAGRYSYVGEGLRIQDVTEEDNGVYNCRAEVIADGRLQDRRITVTVAIPPTITRPPGVVEAVLHQEATLSCAADGKPEPKFRFFRDGTREPIVNEDRILVNEDRGTVYIRRVVELDAGGYRCQAISAAGSVTAKGELKVIIPPQIVKFHNVTVKEGEATVLSCQVRAVPEASIAFRKKGSSVDYKEGDNKDGVVIRRPSENVLELVLESSRSEHSSMYSCSAHNKGGNTTKNGTVSVLFAPKFADDHPTVFYSWVNKRINVTCEVLAEPMPYIEWYRNDFHIKENNETFRIMPRPDFGRKSSLQVHIHEQEVGWIFQTYTCRPRNNIGVGELDIKLKQAYKPDAPSEIVLIDSTPTTIELKVIPPVKDGGMPVYGYRVEWEGTARDFKTGERIFIDGLKPISHYIFLIRAKNEVGAGKALEYSIKTASIRAPYPLIINSDREGSLPYSYLVRWKRPRTGGHPIVKYTFRFRRITMVNNSWTVDRAVTDFVQRAIDDDAERPMIFYRLESLRPDSFYELHVSAENDIGRSDEVVHFFRTAEAGPHEPDASTSKASPITRWSCTTAVGTAMAAMAIKSWVR